MQSPNEVLGANELALTQNVDRILPVTGFNSKHYRGDAFLASLNAIMLSVLPARQIELKWKIKEKPGVTYASLGSDLSTLYFYQMLIRMGEYRHILELGTYLGVSALFLAEAAGVGSHVITVEKGEEFFELACENVRANGYAARIRPVLGDVLDVLRAEDAGGITFDFILVDAAKEHYGEMLDPALACLSSHGLIVFDDVLMHGDVLNEKPVLQKSAGVLDLLAAVSTRRDLHAVLLPIGNGLLMVRHAH